MRQISEGDKGSPGGRGGECTGAREVDVVVVEAIIDVSVRGEDGGEVIGER